MADSASQSLTLPTSATQSLAKAPPLSFIINGQSNAYAAKQNGSTSAAFNEGPDILTKFAGSFVEAKGGDLIENASIGQWGITLARLMLDEVGGNAVVFQGSNAAQVDNHIAEYLPGAGSGNYNTLKARVDASELEPRWLIWSQGESDFDTLEPDYLSRFTTLHAAWLADFPSLEKIVIIKIVEPITGGLSSVPVGGAQRTAAATLDRVVLMSVDDLAVLTAGWNGIHFLYEQGYREHANRLLSILLPNL